MRGIKRNRNNEREIWNRYAQYLVSFFATIPLRSYYFFPHSLERFQRAGRSGRSYLSLLTFVSFRTLERKTHISLLSLLPLQSYWTLEMTMNLESLETISIRFRTTMMAIVAYRWATLALRSWKSVFSLRSRWTRGPSHTVDTGLTLLTHGESAGETWLTLLPLQPRRTSKTAGTDLSGITSRTRLTLNRSESYDKHVYVYLYIGQGGQR